jgi:hypothetical protein
MPAFLARRYAAVIDVERADDVPATFVWRGRRYAVTEVLDHWWETAAWWMGETASGSVAPGVPAQSRSAHFAGSSVGCSDDEREFWRVEARASHGSAVVELCFGWSTGMWTVTAVFD